MPARDPEPFTTEDTGDYWDGHDDPKPEPEAEDYDPPTCDRCGTYNDEWDRYCTCCGYPVGDVCAAEG